jgi:hypothetical protein
MNAIELEPILERFAEAHLYHIEHTKLRGWGIERDNEGYFFRIYTINTDCSELPSVWEGIRVKQQVRPEAFTRKTK